MRSIVTPAALAALFLATASVAPVAAAQDAPAASVLTDAPTYLRMAASGDLFEIQSSQLALQSSRNAELRRIAQMIIADHTRLSSELKAAAASAGIQAPPPILAAHHAQMLERLRTAGAGFDALYRQQQVTAHREALALHRGYARGGDVAALKQAAAKAVPVIERHLQHVQAPSAR